MLITILHDTVPVSETCSVVQLGPALVHGNSAVVVFRGLGSGITGFLCRLDGVTLPECELNKVQSI